MKKKKTNKTKRVRKPPKTRYAVNRKPVAETRKFARWAVSRGITVIDGKDLMNNMILKLMWETWQAALPRVRK